MDAGNSLLVKVYVVQARDKWLLNDDNVDLWESNKLTAVDRRILIMQWAGRAIDKIDSDIKKAGLAMRAQGSDNHLITLEGVTQAMHSFIDVGTTPEPQEDVLPISPAPADEEHPPGSIDEDESDDEEGKAEREGEKLRRDVDETTILDIVDKLADDEVPLPLQTPGGYSLVSSALAALTAALEEQPVMLRLGVGWLMAIITRQAQARTRHLHDFGVFLDRDGSTLRVKLPLASNSVDRVSAEGSWALLMR